MGQVESSLAATSSIGSMASQSGVTSIRTNSWAATASFRGSTSNNSTTTPNEQTNNGFVTVQYPLTNNGFTTVQNPLRNQPKAISPHSMGSHLYAVNGTSTSYWERCSIGGKPRWARKRIADSFVRCVLIDGSVIAVGRVLLTTTTLESSRRTTTPYLPTYEIHWCIL